MGVDRDQCIAAIQHSIETSIALRHDLERGEQIGHRMIAALLDGVDIHNSVEAAGESPAELRQTSADVYELYRQRRHEMRALFLAAARESGLSDSELARRLGISRQAVEKTLKESSHKEH